jgi:hypothetical protein
VMPAMALGQERPGVLQMLFGEGLDFESRHRRRTIPLAP